MTSTHNFTDKQGQYLAYINLYQRLHRRAPSEAELQAYFCVSPPSVHRMIVELERKHLISRTLNKARSIRILLPEADIPQLKSIITSGMQN